MTASTTHAAVPSKDWMKQGAHARCTCGAYRCPVLIERGELNPICSYCGWGFDPETEAHEVAGQDDHWPQDVNRKDLGMNRIQATKTTATQDVTLPNYDRGKGGSRGE